MVNTQPTFRISGVALLEELSVVDMMPCYVLFLCYSLSLHGVRSIIFVWYLNITQKVLALIKRFLLKFYDCAHIV